MSRSVEKQPNRRYDMRDQFGLQKRSLFWVKRLLVFRYGKNLHGIVDEKIATINQKHYEGKQQKSIQIDGRSQKNRSRVKRRFWQDHTFGYRSGQKA